MSSLSLQRSRLLGGEKMEIWRGDDLSIIQGKDSSKRRVVGDGDKQMPPQADEGRALEILRLLVEEWERSAHCL